MIAGLDELSHLVRPEREHDLRVYIVHKAQRQRKLGQFLARLHRKRRVLTASDIVQAGGTCIRTFKAARIVGHPVSDELRFGFRLAPDNLVCVGC